MNDDKLENRENQENLELNEALDAVSAALRRVRAAHRRGDAAAMERAWMDLNNDVCDLGEEVGVRATAAGVYPDDNDDEAA